MTFFKYMHEDRIENILYDNKLRFTQPKFFNDPFDVNPYINASLPEKILKKVTEEDLFELEKILQDSEVGEFVLTDDETEGLARGLASYLNSMNPGEVAEIYKDKVLKKLINDNMGVLSLTTKFDNLLMWAHYANDHKGFVVEFNTEDPFFYKALKVDYKQKRPREKIGRENKLRILFTKSIHWEYENEYRMLRKLKDAEEIRNDIHLFKFPRISIKSIYCGCNMKDCRKNDILKLIEENKTLKHINVYYAKTSGTHYKLDFEKIR